jgi:hypothetical protein
LKAKVGIRPETPLFAIMPFPVCFIYLENLLSLENTRWSSGSEILALELDEWNRTLVIAQWMDNDRLSRAHDRDGFHSGRKPLNSYQNRKQNHPAAPTRQLRTFALVILGKVEEFSEERCAPVWHLPIGIYHGPFVVHR